MRKNLARFLCGCGISPEVVESQFFLKFCCSLNSGYEGVTAKKKRQHDIPTLYAATKREVKEMISGQAKLSLGFDGFKDESGSHVINFVETVEEKCAFRTCLDPEGA